MYIIIIIISIIRNVYIYAYLETRARNALVLLERAHTRRRIDRELFVR